MKLGVESILKLSNAWVSQIYYMISMAVMPIKAEHAVAKAKHVGWASEKEISNLEIWGVIVNVL